MMEISKVREQVHGDTENVIGEEGQSSESVTNISDSADPGQDYESSYTSLKLGLVHHPLIKHAFGNDFESLANQI